MSPIDQGRLQAALQISYPLSELKDLYVKAQASIERLIEEGRDGDDKTLATMLGYESGLAELLEARQ